MTTRQSADKNSAASAAGAAVRRAVAVASIATFAALVLASPALATPGQTTRESVSASGTQGTDDSGGFGPLSISGDGLVTAFASRATNLVPDDTNLHSDVFVRDRSTGTFARVSVAGDGTQSDGDSDGAAISANGRQVAFASNATNLVTGDTNSTSDIFVRDRQTGTTVRVSVASGGAQSDGLSINPSISADGRFVAYESDATNLVTGDANGSTDVFVHDRDANDNGVFDEPGATATTRVSVSSTGAESDDFSGNAAISADGRQVAFQSGATNLVADDTNDARDVFARDRQTGTTTRVSVSSTGAQASLSDPDGFLISGNSIAISGDGTQVAFESTADNLVPADTNKTPDVFVRDRTAGKTVRVSVASDGTQSDGSSDRPSLSFTGRLVSFSSGASTLVVFPAGTFNPGSVFVHDRDGDGNGTFDAPGAGATATTLESVASDGTPGDNGGGIGSISADGSRVAFDSFATNLVSDDTNAKNDIFVHRLSAPVGTQPLGVSKAGDGQGTVTSSPAAGIACGTDCTHDFASGTMVTLNATPDSNSSFAGFSGDCTGAGPCTVTLDRARSVTATFVRLRLALTVSKAGDGQGKVTSSLPGIDCGTDCSETYGAGTQVTLTARAFTGFPASTFSGFSGGGCSGGATTCTVALDQAQTVTATFAQVRRTLTVSKAGDGQGTVTSSPAGIDCGGDCSEDYPEGAKARLTAAPAAAFAGFSGACTGTGPCTVTLDKARSVTATFEDTSSGSGTPPGQSGSGPAPTGTTGPDKIPPSVSNYGLTNSPFVVGGRTPTIGVAAKAKKHKQGTTFRYTLSEAAAVKIVISQGRSGRRKGRRCVAPTPKLRHGKKCTRVSVKGTLTRTSHQGKNSVAFSGRIGSRALTPGRYQATLTATDAAQNSSRPKTISFTIVKR